jgi:hypothetical protein
VTEADVIGILREAAETLAVVAIAGYVSESHQADLRQLEHDCMDAARWLAARDQTVTRP